MTHRLFGRRENGKSCETCREVPAGPPCYDCTFGLQTPPPRYTSVQQDSDRPLQPTSSLPFQECTEFGAAALVHDVSRIGMAVAMVVDRSDADALQVPASDAVTRTRHLSDQIVRNSDHLGLTRNVSAPHLHSWNGQMDECVMAAPLPPEEEPHLLLVALATVSPSPEPGPSVAEESPLPCQLLIPE